MTRPTLVMVTTSFPIAGDGSEAAGAFVADLAEELTSNFNIRIVAPGTTSAIERWSKHIDVYRYAAPKSPLSTLKPWRMDDLAWIYKVLKGGQRATEQASEGAEHILALWALPSGQWARTAARRRGIDYSVWTLGSDIWSLGKIPLLRARLRSILRNARHCWSDGIELGCETKAIAGREVVFLPSTRRIDADARSSNRSQPPFRLLFLGRWHPNKGVDLLMQALSELRVEDWAQIERITVAGGGALEPLVLSSAANLMRAGRPVEVRGYLSRDEASSAMLNADYLLIPSRIESIPVVFSDAMKLGLPVVSMPVGDLPTLVTSEIGVLASNVSAEAFANAMRTILAADPARFELQTMRDRFDLGKTAQSITAAVLPNKP